jgi:hypothetical protein
VVEIAVERDGCGPGHVVLGIDGEFQFFTNRGCNFASPDGRLMADPGGYGCFLVGDDLVQILDSITGDELTRYAEARTVLTPWSWSPDSAEVLVRRGHVPERFDPRDPAEDCAFMESEEFDSSFDWITINAATGAATPVEDFDALFNRWFPEHRVTLSCGTPLPQVLWSRFGRMRARCDSEAGMGTVSVDGVAVGEATEIQVLGFVER